MANGTCTVDGCSRERRCRGLCALHYGRQYKYGSTDPRPPRKFTEADFWARVEKGPSCWIWTGRLDRHGYGVFGNREGAHRYAYRLANGEIPAGLKVDHICHSPKCVRPEHLRLATQKQNQENRAGASRHSKSGVRGVHWDETKRRWVAQVRHHGSGYYQKRFRTLEEAEAAVIAKRNELFTHNDLDRLGRR